MMECAKVPRKDQETMQRDEQGIKKNYLRWAMLIHPSVIRICNTHCMISMCQLRMTHIQLAGLVKDRTVTILGTQDAVPW